MSYWDNRKLYYQLLEKFINGKIDGVVFETKFSILWRKDRDSESNTANFKINLRCYSNSKIQQDILVNVLSRIFTACDVFDPDPTTSAEYEYSEDDLRDFVRNIVNENETLFKR